MPRRTKTTTPRTRPERRADTREMIRLAAFELFSTIGFDDATTAAVARRARVGAGTVFLHAKDKVDLLSMVMHHLLEDVVEKQFATLPDGLLLDRLLHVFRGLFGMYAKYPKLAAAFVRYFPGATGPNSDRVGALTVEFTDRLGQLVAEAQRRGEVASDLNPALCAQNVFGLYFMALMAWISGHVHIAALEMFLASSLQLQIRGFRPLVE